MIPKISLKDASAAFNPGSYDGLDAQGQVRTGSTPVFNDKGEMNAWDRQDAVKQLLAVVAGMLNGGEGPISRKAAQATAAQRQEYFGALKEALNQGDEGLRLVGQELLNPIREVLDYEGFARKVLAPREVGPGEIPRYDRDAYVTAWVIGADGVTPESRIDARYFYPPEWPVTAAVAITLQNIYQMQYDVLARSQDRARQAVEYKEDSALINLLDTASTTVNDITYITGAYGWDELMDLKYQVEKNRLPADKFLINLSEVRDILKETTNTHFDPVTQREIMLQGYLGNIAGVQVVASAGNGIFEPVPANTVYCVTRPEYLGGMPIRVPLMSEPVNKFVLNLPEKGWFFYELISQVILNPRGVAKAVK